MSTPSLASLLCRWEDAFREGRDLAAEALCPERPELAAELQRAIDAMRQMNALLAGESTHEPLEGEGVPTRAPAPDGESPATVPPCAAEPGRLSRAVPGYEVLGELGRGGMGVVYKARQTALGRVVALKMILAGGHAGEAELARFRTEAEAVARLQHPNVVQVFEVGSSEGVTFLALEHCPGGGLDRKLNGTPMQPRAAAELMAKLAEAVQAAHDARVVHRDLKPANVLLAADGTPKISDFGLARKLDEAGQTVTGAVMGTPSYMAPEQAQGKKDVGPAADTWALGAILYECLTGRPPFRAATPMDTIMQVIREEPVPPRQLNAALPRDLETIALKCLTKEPARRYADCAALAEDLRRWLAGEPVAARRPGPAERAVRWARRNPAVAALGALVLIALAAGSAVATTFGVLEKRALDKAKEEAAAKDRALSLARAEAKRANAARAEAEENERRAKQNEKRADEEKYRANVASHSIRVKAALKEWERHHVARAEAILDEVAPEFRAAFECRHLRELCRRKMMTLRGHLAGVEAVAYSPDGSRIASASGDGTVKVWEARSGRELLSLGGHGHDVRALAFSPDGSRLSGGGGGATVWDLRSCERLFTRKGEQGPVFATDFSGAKAALLEWEVKGQRSPKFPVAFSPDGSCYAFASGGRTVDVCDARTCQQLLPLWQHEGPVLALAFSPDGSRLAAGGGLARAHRKEVKVWNARTGRKVLSLEGVGSLVRAVAYTPDASRIVSGHEDGTLEVWDAHSGQALFTAKGHVGEVSAVACSPDGSRIASGGGDGTVRVWDFRAGQDVLTSREVGPVYALAFSPDGSRLALGGDFSVKVRDAQTWEDLLGLRKDGNGLAYSRDGSRLATSGEAWDARTGGGLLAFGETWLAAAYSPDGARLASESRREVNVWDARTGKVLLTLPGHEGSVNAVAYNRDGSRIASGSQDRTVKVWDARTGQVLHTLDEHTGPVLALAHNPDGDRIVSASEDRTLKLWDAATGQELLTLEGHDGPVTAVAYSPDGSRIVSAGGDGALNLWDARTGRELLTLKAHASEVLSVAFSPDGSCIASAGLDRKVRLWGAKPGQDPVTLKGHRDRVSAVTFSPQGERVASTSTDGALKVWDSRTGRNLLTVKGEAEDVIALAFSPDGERIFGRLTDGKILAWQARSGKALPDAPGELPREPRVTHGSRRAFADGKLVRIERVRTPEEWRRYDLGEGRVEAILRARRDRDVRRADADLALARGDVFAGTFHLDRLLALSPGERPALLRRRAAVLSAAVKADPDDDHSARSLARQAVADPESVPDARALLPLLARHQHAPLDRLYGALLLRTGDARQAVVVLSAGVRNRTGDRPPIDELLLALALIKFDRRGEARRHLANAGAWIDQGAVPARLASLLAGRLAALGALAHAPDPRLNPLDPFTAHELYALRREVERALDAP